MVQSVSGPHHEVRNAGVGPKSEHKPRLVSPLNPQKRQGTDEAISVSHVFLLESSLAIQEKIFRCFTDALLVAMIEDKKL
jgi:hypothetical protein